MLKRLAAVSVFALIAACGSSDGPKGNAAANTTFTYGGTPTTITGSSSDAISRQVQSMITTTGAPTGTNAGSFQDFSSISDSLLGANPYSGYGKMIPGSPSAARDLAFKLIADQKRASSQAIDPTCYTETATSATFNNCTDSRVVEGVTITLTINGSLSVTGTYTMAWNFTISVVGVGTGVSANATFTTSGDITLTELTDTTGTIVGDEIAAFDMTLTAEGETVHIAVAESLNLDVQYDTACDYFVVGGTLEAKRVWTARPQGMENELPNAAVKVTWTGCGAGTFQVGVQQ